MPREPKPTTPEERKGVADRIASILSKTKEQSEAFAKASDRYGIEKKVGLVDYEPFSKVYGPTMLRTLEEGLLPLQGQNLRDAFVLAQVQGIVEDVVWQYQSTASVRLEYVDAASLLAVFRVEGMMVDTIRVRLATPDVQTAITYKSPPPELHKKDEQE